MVKVVMQAQQEMSIIRKNNVLKSYDESLLMAEWKNGKEGNKWADYEIRGYRGERNKENLRDYGNDEDGESGLLYYAIEWNKRRRRRL